MWPFGKGAPPYSYGESARDIVKRLNVPCGGPAPMGFAVQQQFDGIIAGLEETILGDDSPNAAEIRQLIYSLPETMIAYTREMNNAAVFMNFAYPDAPDWQQLVQGIRDIAQSATRRYRSVVCDDYSEYAGT